MTLTMRQVEFPKTHDIQELLNLVGTVDGILADSLRQAISLTPYGVEIRYPAGLPDPSQGEAEQALILAEKVRAAIARMLR
ncbi:MAG: HEPN domain-containing protein [Nitrospinae bacterium]|nr:HEPN domain-containing protein [Nitrospinota bacterium]